jgi:peroxiredoxin
MKLRWITAFVLILFSVAGVVAQKADKRGFVVKVGDMAPDFTVNYADGRKSVKLSDLRGKVVMLQFTASWCSVCRKEMPHIEKEIWKVFKDKDFALLGVDRGEKQEVVNKFAKKMKVTYPLILDEESEIFQLYADKRSGVTRNVIIDKSGKIVFLTRLFERNEFDAMIDKIKELL